MQTCLGFIETFLGRADMSGFLISVEIFNLEGPIVLRETCLSEPCWNLLESSFKFVVGSRCVGLLHMVA